MHCSTNYEKETVLKLFQEALTDYGAPPRIRADKGGETTLIWELMTEIRDNGRGIFLASSSVHYQRIKWLWRDLWNAVCSTFCYMFPAMEVQGL